MAHKSPEDAEVSGDIFCDLNPRQRGEIEQAISYSTYAAGHIFHSPGEQGSQLFLLRAGRVQLYKLSSEGRMLRLSMLEPVVLFGEMAMIDTQGHTTFAEAMTSCVVGSVSNRILSLLIQTHPQMTVRLLELIGHRVRELESRVADIAFKSVPQRLASVLLSLGGVPSDQVSTPLSPVIVRYTHQQLAEMIGSYRATVTRIIGEFQEAGLIRVEGDVIYLTDLKRLQRLVHKGA